jgi:DNA-binding NarL/FixJ family response regulator
MTQTQIIIVARYPTVRAGLASLLSGETDISVIADTDDVSLLPALIEEHLPDALLIDLVDDTPDRLDALQMLAGDGLLPPVVLLSGSPADALGALGLPLVSLLLRDARPEEIRAALRSTREGLSSIDPRIVSEIHEQLEWQQPSGQSPDAVALTPRELQVLQGIGRGLPNKAIAVDLGISEHTVKFHVGSIFQKLDVRSRSEAIAVAARRGLLVL